jgi:hypothetical protein
MADVRCRVRSNYGLVDCSNSRVVPGKHELELDGLSPDFYVLSAKANDHDVLAEGLDIQSDTDLEIVFGQNGGFAQGTVRNSSGDTVPGAVVALVPNLPRRQTSLLFQNVVTDRDGKFELRGIAPGSYKLFSWTELTGAGYRNADFMKDFDARGTQVQFENGSRLTVNLVVFSGEN